MNPAANDNWRRTLPVGLTDAEAFMWVCDQIHAAALEHLKAVPATLRAAGDPTDEEVTAECEVQKELIAAWARDAIQTIALEIFADPRTARRH